MEDRNVNSLSDFAINATGAAIGASIGLVGGPVGTVAGAVIGAGVSEVLSRAKLELSQRFISKKEEEKISSVISLTDKCIKENIKNGKTLRDDDFFDSTDNNRSTAKETFEGIMFATQRENEEKKIPYFASLYANIACDKSITRAQAIQLIHTAFELSYRQLLIIQTIAFFQLGKQNFGTLQGDTLRKTPIQSISGYNTISILTEILNLYHRGILQSTSIIFDIPSIIPDNLSVVGVGAKLYELMELKRIPFDNEVYETLREK